jgi:hypothetical protein
MLRKLFRLLTKKSSWVGYPTDRHAQIGATLPAERPREIDSHEQRKRAQRASQMLTKNAEALQNTETLREITPYGLTRHGEPAANRYIGAPAIKSAEYPKSPNPAITVAGPCPLIPLSAPRRRGALWLLLLKSLARSLLVRLLHPVLRFCVPRSPFFARFIVAIILRLATRC